MPRSTAGGLLIPWTFTRYPDLVPESYPLFDKLRAQIAQGFGPSPLGEHLGFQFVDLQVGQVTIKLPITPPVLNSMGYLHGGTMAALADTALGFAAFTMLQEGESTTTAEFKINFVRPVFSGTITCIGRVLKHGRQQTLLEAEMFNEEGKLVAKALGTTWTLRGEATQNRRHD